MSAFALKPLLLAMTMGSQPVPSLDLDYEAQRYRVRDYTTQVELQNSTFADLHTFTRSSVGTAFNEYGVLTQYAADIPRFQHDPATLVTGTSPVPLTIGADVVLTVPATHQFAAKQVVRVTGSAGSAWGRVARAVPGATSIKMRIVSVTGSGTLASWTAIRSLGLLIEESRTNALTFSSFPNGVSDAPSRGGALTASGFDTKIAATGLQFGSGQTTYAYKQVSVTSGVAYRFSCFVIMDDGLAPDISGTNTTATTDFLPIFSGIFILSSTRVVENMGGGVYRIQATHTATASGTVTIGVAKYVGNSSRGFRVTGYDLQKGSFGTSHIPTTSIAVSRAADVCPAPTTGGWYNAAAGSIVATCNGAVPNGDTSRDLMELSEGNTATRALSMRLQRSAALPYPIGVVWTTTTTALFSVITAITAIESLAMAWVSGGSAIYVRGGASPSAPSATMTPPASSVVCNVGGRTGNQVNGCVGRARYYPRNLSSQLLQRLTA